MRNGRRGYDVALLTTAEPGRRNRRTIDALLLAFAALLTTAAAVIARSAPAQDEDIADAIVTILGWAEGFWRVVVVVFLLLGLAIVLDCVVRRRWDLARDFVVTMLVLAGLGTLLGQAVGPDWFAADDDLWSRWGFPEYRLAVVTAVAAVIGPELVVGVRRVLFWLLGLAAVGLIAVSAALPSDVLGALALGLLSATVVRLIFGSAAGIPPSSEVTESLQSLGVDVDDLRPSLQQERGAATYVGQQDSGRPLNVRVLGRDAQDTQRLARRWRLLAYRDPGRSAPIGRLEQVEHEALVTMVAAQSGVRTPDLVTAALGSRGDALVVTTQPDIRPVECLPADQVTDEVLVALWKQVATLHAAGISHGRLNTGRVLLVEPGPMLVGFSAATLGAPQSAIDIDVAELLVSCTVLVGPDRALRSAIDGAGAKAVVGSLPYLQRAALTPHTRDLARADEVALDTLRAQAATATGVEEPEITPMRRVTWRDLLTTAAVGVAAYLLISQLAEVGFETIWDALRNAEPVWLVTGLLLAQIGLIPEAISLRGAVVTPLPLLPCVALKSANKFVGLTVPGSAGTIAVTVRFIQRLGGKTGEALASGAVDDLAEKAVQICIILIVLPFVDLNVDTSDIHIGAPDASLVTAIVVAIIVSILVICLVPAVRNKIVPPMREGIAALRQVLRDRRKRQELFGGNLAGELMFALTLGAVCLGFGVHLSLAELLVVNLAASALAGLIPAPGGVGAAEATLTACLVAFGVDDSTAFAIAITHRLCTNYLPPIWGYASLKWLERNGYV
ncbi:MAG TPA: lysylphosphatidylglycerol synthase transmembrane domain-containing protein [Nocardioidaceae bacterium]|nr:lysylphosphatidylglycerol synthase transmembrane domain-containing protein [Nocardioidaceae bacterium]